MRPLQYHQILVLEKGNAIFYHEGQTEADEIIYILIYISGRLTPAYFDFLSTANNFDMSILRQYGQIIDWGYGQKDALFLKKRVEDFMDRL